MDQMKIIDKLLDNSNRSSALEVLMQVEGVLDRLNVYAYDNWIEGEVVDGPDIERYWVTVTLMYPYKSMPDPDGAERLTRKGCKVFYAKDDLITAAKLVEPEDRDPNGDERRIGQSAAKKVKKKIWLITLVIPRQFMDTITADTVELDNTDVNIDAVDTDAVESAQDAGLGDDDAIQS